MKKKEKKEIIFYETKRDSIKLKREHNFYKSMSMKLDATKKI